jgi:hypothetical protein
VAAGLVHAVGVGAFPPPKPDEGGDGARRLLLGLVLALLLGTATAVAMADGAVGAAGVFAFDWPALARWPASTPAHPRPGGSILFGHDEA